MNCFLSILEISFFLQSRYQAQPKRDQTIERTETVNQISFRSPPLALEQWIVSKVIQTLVRSRATVALLSEDHLQFNTLFGIAI